MLETRRAELGISRSAVARQLGVTQPTISRLFSGPECPPVDTVARIFELRGAGLSFKKIGKALGIAAWTASRYVRSFEEGDR